jgi:hypothetical protein
MTMSEVILNDTQRRDLQAYSDAEPGSMDDAGLLSAAADRMGMTGELAVDAEGILELVRDDVLVVLEAVADEDRDLVDHPDLLHLAVLLRVRTAEDRAALEKANLLDPDVPGEAAADDWAYAWWGSMATRLPQDTPISSQMEALNRVMGEAEQVLRNRDLAGFFDRMAWLQHPDDVDDDDFDDDDLDGDDWQPEDDE